MFGGNYMASVRLMVLAICIRNYLSTMVVSCGVEEEGVVVLYGVRER